MIHVRRIVDLSHTIDDDTPVYPGDPVVRIEPAMTIAVDGFDVRRVRMGSQTGTHIDAPRHFFADGTPVDELALLGLCGPAVIVDVRGRRPGAPIRWRDLAPVAAGLRPGVMLVLHTGWSAHWGTAAYHDHPFLDADAADGVIRRGVRTIGIDAPSLDETTAGAEHPSGFAAHRAVLGAGGVIAENLTNLAAIDFPDPVISLLPMPLRGADGAPVRAVAMDVSA